MNTTIKLRRDTASRWRYANPVLAQGEPGVELDTGRFKLGDGVSRWQDLGYFVPYEESDFPDLPPDSLLFQHIESELPHPIYDDGPSLTLLYENAKV